MKIFVFEPIGQCVGVNLAINNALKIKEENEEKNVILFGSLAHNEKILEELSKNGLKTIDIKNFDENEKNNLLSSFDKNSIIIFQAHGTIKKYKNILIKNGVPFFDLTCPIILENKELIKKSILDNKKIIFVGKKDHEETKSILDVNKNIFFYDIKEGFIKKKPSKKDAISVYFQTSLSINDFKLIKKELEENFENISFNCSLCKNILKRQENILNSKQKFDLVLIIGSKTSSNTNELFSVARSHFESSLVMMINSAEELKNIDFSIYENVAIASGTSAFNKTVEEILAYLKSINL